jgi:ribosomal protein S18 acetylase RimI-like enzyme
MEDSLDEVLLSEIGFVRFVLRSPLASALQRCSVKVRSFQTYVGILAVHPNWRSQGIGRQLLMQAERCAKEAGDTAVCLDVEIANVRACRFYQACGYSIESERKAPFWLRRHKISGLRRMVKEL